MKPSRLLRKFGSLLFFAVFIIIFLGLLLTSCGSVEIPISRFVLGHSAVIDKGLHSLRMQAQEYFSALGLMFSADALAQNAASIGIGQEICEQPCPADLQNTAFQAVVPANIPASIFTASVEFLGGSSVFGRPLSTLYIAEDGNLEMIYEKAVFFAPADNPGLIQLRRLPALVDIPVMAPTTQQYGLESEMSFYTTDGELGYHVPLVFEHFLQEHGGVYLSGKPIGDPVYYEGASKPRQCFEKICLEYNPKAPGQKVYLANLGKQYRYTNPVMGSLVMSGAVETALKYTEASHPNLAFLINEGLPQVGRSGLQTIQVLIYDRETYQPLSNAAATLLVIHPDGSEVHYLFPPTTSDGSTSLEIRPMGDSPDGSLVSYEVCLLDSTAGCKREAFIIWGD